MKKIVVGFLVTFGMAAAGFADTTTVTFPTTAQNSFLNGQVIATIINHGSFSSEVQRGSRRTVLSDNIIEAGHLKGQYVAALDGSLYSDPTKTGLFPFDYEVGVRLNINTIVNNYVTFTPQWAAILGNLEYYVRTGYDFGQDKTHAWFGSVNLGFGFGAGAGVPAQ